VGGYEDESTCEQLAALVCWCVALGITTVTIYDAEDGTLENSSGALVRVRASQHPTRVLFGHVCLSDTDRRHAIDCAAYVVVVACARAHVCVFWVGGCGDVCVCACMWLDTLDDWPPWPSQRRELRQQMKVAGVSVI
jgi:hypothetical protein